MPTLAQISPYMAQSETRYGLPAGTLTALMKQESDPSYLVDPTKYHYPLNSAGNHVTPNGTISSAFGPFGILDSTAKDPGYGVKPLASKGIYDQIDFTASYLAARSKASGNLSGGLAGYGEGAGYAAQVMDKLRNILTPGINGNTDADASASSKPGILEQAWNATPFGAVGNLSSGVTSILGIDTTIKNVSFIVLGIVVIAGAIFLGSKKQVISVVGDVVKKAM